MSALARPVTEIARRAVSRSRISPDDESYRNNPDELAIKWKVKRVVLHPKQRGFVESTAKRKCVRAGRRGGKTIGASDIAVEAFLNGKRVLYAAPTLEQVQSFWFAVKASLGDAIDAGDLHKNESEHFIEIPNTKQRIKAKTAWNAETLRGDYADLLILDEFQMMNEDTWSIVGAPMLLDNNGDAVFIYTPPSLRTAGATKARDPRHASKLYKKHENDTTGRWECFHFTSHDNPYISAEALSMITEDMTKQAIEQEIEAKDDDVIPGALWTPELIEACRHHGKLPEFVRIVVPIDPAGSSNNSSNQTGVGVVALGVDGIAYVMESLGMTVKPEVWAQQAVDWYYEYEADRVVGENNYGGEMVESTVRAVDPNVSYKNVHASRGKMVRAEPVSALYEKGRVKHVGEHDALEYQYTNWKPGMKSPDLLDMAVWGITELMLNDTRESTVEDAPDWINGRGL